MNFSCAIPGTNRTIPFTNRTGPVSEKYPVELSEWQIGELRKLGFTVNVIKEVKPTVEAFQRIEEMKQMEAAMKKLEEIKKDPTVVNKLKDGFDKYVESLPVEETPLKEEVVEAMKKEGEEFYPEETKDVPLTEEVKVDEDKTEYDELNKLETKDLKKILYADLKLGTSGDRDMLIKRIIKGRKDKK